MTMLLESNGHQPALTRRRFLRMSAIGAALAMPAVLAACGGSAAPAAAGGASSSGSAPASNTTSGPTAAASSAAAGQSSAGAAAPKPAGGPLKLPTLVPIQGIQPDLPGAPDGTIDPAFQGYPKNPVKTVPNPPGKGGDITITTSSTLNPPTPVDQSTMWQAINKELGASLKFNIVPFADYKSVRLPTLLAGGDLPDVLFIQPQTALPSFPAFLKAKCADLTPYLSGDAVKDYPNLAGIPTLAWRNTAFNNAIWGVPVAYPLYLWVLWAHQEVLDQAGIPMPKTADDFKKALVAVNKPQQSQWGMGTEKDYGFAMLTGLFPAIFGVPTGWSVDNSGKFTFAAETDAWKQALSYVHDLYAAGVFHPNSLTNDVNTKRTDFAARRFVFNFDGLINASRTYYWPSITNFTPPAKYRLVPPFSNDGVRKPVYWPGQPGQTGSFGFVVLKQASPNRIKEVLGVLNYMAAPFGSHEYLLMNFGVQGTDYQPDDKGNPVLTAKGKAESTLPWMGVVQREDLIYYPTAQDYAPILQDGEKAMQPYNVLDASIGLYSDTYTGKGVLLQQGLADGLNQIIRGNAPLTSWDQTLSDWKSKGGEQMRTEYQQAYAASKG